MDAVEEDAEDKLRLGASGRAVYIWGMLEFSVVRQRKAN